MTIANVSLKTFAAAAILFSFTSASFALDWVLDDVDSQRQISDGGTGGYVEICYDRGSKNTVAIFFGRDLIFWLIKGSCVRVRNQNLDVSISGHLVIGDFAKGTARKTD